MESKQPIYIRNTVEQYPVRDYINHNVPQALCFTFACKSGAHVYELPSKSLLHSIMLLQWNFYKKSALDSSRIIQLIVTRMAAFVPL